MHTPINEKDLRYHDLNMANPNIITEVAQGDELYHRFGLAKTKKKRARGEFNITQSDVTYCNCVWFETKKAHQYPALLAQHESGELRRLVDGYSYKLMESTPVPNAKALGHRYGALFVFCKHYKPTLLRPYTLALAKTVGIDIGVGGITHSRLYRLPVIFSDYTYKTATHNVEGELKSFQWLFDKPPISAKPQQYRCTSCKETKPTMFFGKGTRPNGVSTVCKVCSAHKAIKRTHDRDYCVFEVLYRSGKYLSHGLTLERRAEVFLCTAVVREGLLFFCVCLFY